MKILAWLLSSSEDGESRKFVSGSSTVQVCGVFITEFR
jgi:hypothetical protein